MPCLSWRSYGMPVREQSSPIVTANAPPGSPGSPKTVSFVLHPTSF
jgi:hypothetical protein